MRAGRTVLVLLDYGTPTPSLHVHWYRKRIPRLADNHGYVLRCVIMGKAEGSRAT